MKDKRRPTMQNRPILKPSVALFAFAFAVAGMTVLLTAAEPPSLNEHLQPLKFYLGNWNLRWTNPDGQALPGKATFKADAGGSIVSGRTEFTDKEGNLLSMRLSVISWQVETRSVTEVYFESNGSHGSNVLVDQAGARLLWQGHGYGGDGKPGHGMMELQKVDENTWTARFVRVTHAGEPVPNSPKVVFTRTK